jgi:rsbT antagonist protein RsbS
MIRGASMQIPILKLKNILLTSIQSDMTDDDALRYQSDVVSFLEKSDAKGLIIDITAMDIVDSFMARVINETARMARLMGAKVVLCGMQPMVALTLVEMGRELIGVDTALNLDKGFDKLLEMISEGVD